MNPRSFFAALGVLLLASTCLMAQRGGRGGGGASPAAELIVHGSVVLEGGIVPLRLVRLVKVCGGRAAGTAFADSKGHFSFNLGYVETGRGAGPGQALGTIGGKTSKAMDQSGCSIRASLAGYAPQSASLAPAARGDKTNLGELVLKRLGTRPTALVSTTDEDASPIARKDYEKGLDEVAKGKFKDAISAMKRTTSEDSKFATAWFTLGTLQFSQNEPDAALKSFGQAIAADANFAPSYIQAAVVESGSNQWAKAVEHAGKAITLDPDAFPEAYFLSAMANIRLGRADAASRSVAEGIRLDPDHEFPDLVYMDGILRMNKGDREGAHRQLQSYLDVDPNGDNADNARQMLTRLATKK